MIGKNCWGSLRLAEKVPCFDPKQVVYQKLIYQLFAIEKL